MVMQEMTISPRGSNGADCVALSHKLGDGLKEAMQAKGGNLEIIFYSNESGAILVDGKVAFDVTVSVSDLLEPYVTDDSGQLKYRCSVLGRCTVSARGSSSSSSSSSSAAAASSARHDGPQRPVANKMDMKAVKAASSLELNKPVQPRVRRVNTSNKAAAQSLGVRGVGTNNDGAKKRKRGDAKATTSCAVLRSIPLRTTQAELGSFLLDLNAVDMFCLPHALDVGIDDAGDGELSLADCLCDVYVVFDTVVAASLAQKRSGEKISVSSSSSSSLSKFSSQRAVAVTVDIASEQDLFLAQGLGMRLCSQSKIGAAGSGKSASALSKLRSVRSSIESLSASQSDRDAFRRVLLQNGTQRRNALEELLQGISWRPAAVFDETLLDLFEITNGVAVVARDCGNRPQDFPDAWSTRCISQTFFASAIQGQDAPAKLALKDTEPLQYTVHALGTIKHLLSVSALECVQADDEGSARHAPLLEFLTRLYALYSAILCVLWKKRMNEDLGNNLP